MLTKKKISTTCAGGLAILLISLLGYLIHTPLVTAAPGDFDNDGVGDFNDIDDDNDGLTDKTEELLIPVLVNPSFELYDPTLATTVWSKANGNAYAFDAADVLGWNTTASDNKIEIWESGHGGVSAQSGSAHMEINAFQSALLYQDFITEGGDIVNWSIWHRGRAGVDVANVLTGSDIGTLAVEATMTTNKTAWVNYTGSFVVPVGQTTTIIAFESVSTASGKATVGNFIDNLHITRTADTDLDNGENHTDLDSDNDGVSDLVESGAAAAIIAADTNYDGTVTIAEAEAILGVGNADIDGDGLMDIFDLDLSSITDVLSVGTVPRQSDASIADIKDLDSDGDDIPDTVEARSSVGYVANDGDVSDQDADGDGVVDLFDTNDATTADFGGSFVPPVDTDLDGTPDYIDTDADADTQLDSSEIAAPIVPDFLDPDGAVTNTLVSLQNTDTDPSDVDFRSWNDADGDGVADANDPNDADVCDPDFAGIPTTKDCDGDGNPVATDLDPTDPDTSGDFGVPDTQIDILANDDFLPNYDPDVLGITSISHVGGTCTGSIFFYANTGTATYTAGAGDTGTQCVIVYEVCSTSISPAVCVQANINITLPSPITDSDGDGIPDTLDLDDDNDGIPDVVEGSSDTDGDSVPDHLDLDSDNDGLTDAFEAGGLDVDGDGIIDGFTDNDGDGLDDATAASPLPVPDTDSDGKPDFQDTDSDDDGIPDAVEAGPVTNQPIDTDSDGLPDFRDTDSDSDGIDDAVEAGSNPAAPQDADGNGVLDYQEPAAIPAPPEPAPGPSADSDGDGIPDSVEGTGDTDGDGIPDYLDIDADNDGILDSTEMTEDTDLDGVPDYLDLDSDNDGLTDTLEAGGTDNDGDGIVDGFTDTNADGLADSVAASPLPEPDTDGDGYVDYLDLDSDNDGISDVHESLGPQADGNNDGMLDNPVDADNNGLADGVNINAVRDTDGDQQPDHLDLDSDNNGTMDLIEAGGVDNDGDGRVEETDPDLQGDGFAPINTVAPVPEDADGNIYIGLDGNGCSIASPGSTSSKHFDPTIPALAVLSMFVLGLRRKSASVVKRTAANRTIISLVAILTSMLFLQACSLFDRKSSANSRVATTSKLSYYDKDQKFRHHAYVATGLGASRLEPDTSEVNSVDVNDRVNAGGQVALGLDVTKHFSLELHSADLGSAGLSPQGRINYHIHGGSALIYAGKNRHSHARAGLTGFGRIGYGVLDDSAIGDVDYIEVNGTHILVGGGFEYATKSGLALRAEAISFDTDVRYGQFALLYRFGGKHRRKPVQIVQAPAPTPEPVYVPPAVPAVVVQEPVEVVFNPCDQFNGVLEGVQFHTDSDRLTDSAQVVLDSVASTLATCATKPVAISAHTDNQGSDEYNQRLSKRRALSVAKYLVNRGINTSRMSARAFGESRPIDTNETPTGRAQNRRVELVVQ